MAQWIDAVKVEELPEGTRVGLKIEGVPLLIAHVEGKFHAMGDRCGHMNAPLSLGKFARYVVTCPMHHAAFDVRTGKKLTEPTLDSPPGADRLPQEFLDYMGEIGKVMAQIETYDQPTYETRVQNGHVQVKLE